MNQPFEDVVVAHGATVLRVCRAVLGPHTDADDAWSETFLSALKAWPELSTATNVQAWLVTIAHRKALDVLRGKARGGALAREAVGGERVRATQPDVAAAAENRDVWRVVATLPPRQRQVIAYRYVGGLPYAQIAELVGGTPEAARRAASDAMKTMRTALVPARTEGVL